MRIQHNIMAMNAYRNYNNNTSALSKNLEKLSSGYKINRAGDDAAGLAISEKMRAQITGLDAAQKNVKDGISLVKTAEGAMQEIQDMLNRMDYLATQSANGTYQNEVDREALQKEVNQLKDEINRIADSANFNGIKLLDGTWAGAPSTSSKPVDTSAYDMTALKQNALTKATTAAGIKNTESVDGSNATDATKAKISIRLKAGVTVDKASIENATVSISGKDVQLKDIFDIKLSDGSDLEDGKMTSSSKIVLTAKTAGKYEDTTLNAIKAKLNAVTFAADSTVPGATDNADSSASQVTLSANIMTSGSDVGEAGSGDAQNAVYNFKVDLSKIDGGTQFEFAGQKITFTKESITNVVNGVTGVNASTGKISIADLDLSKATDQQILQNRIEALFDETAGLTSTTLNKWEFDAGKKTGSTFSFTLTAKESESSVSGTKGNKGQAKVITDSQKGISVVEDSGVDGDNAGPAGTHATAAFQWSKSSLSAGDVITFGGKYSIEIIEDDGVNKEDWNNGKIFASSISADNLNRALQKLGYDDGNVKFVDDNTITVEKKIQDNTTAAAWGAGAGKVEVGTKKVTEEEDPSASGTEATGGKAMTLQIGDTSDSWNQLKVYIGSMKTEALGIADLDISTPETASAAIQTIKDAINQVSSVRGDLGAYQNRLEHTQNNLSVMAENIQDAESTIRDTDVASEMMSYVKNNILVQSAQAMLAQANQVPQGVLQLLG